MNKITSLNKVAVRSNRNKIKKFESEKGIVIHHDLRNLLLNYNMAKPQLTYYCKNGISFNIDYFFGFSSTEYTDFLCNCKNYRTRIPAEMLPLACVNGSDLLCIDNKSGCIYYWFHETDDWGLEGNRKMPVKVSENIASLLELLSAPKQPTKEEMEQAKKLCKAVYMSPKGLELLNEDRKKNGLPVLELAELNMERIKKGLPPITMNISETL